MFKKLLNSFFPNKYNLEHASQEFTQDLLKEYNQSRPLGPQEIICYAPFKNIYFGHYGKATVCCYNRDFEIGSYPQQSIKEIWFSKEADNLRSNIKQNNLDFGCQLCKHHILSKNFEANKAKQYDEQKFNSNHYPSVMEFELSNTCNLECTMCNGNFSSLIRQNRENLPPVPQVYDSNFVNQLEEFIPHLEEVKFYGGEPFLIDIYYQIWEKIIAIKPSVRISVQTNATILNKRVRDLMQTANFHINISIDSLQKDTYESIRLNAKYERVMSNIQWFGEYCKSKGTFFGISACLMTTNYSEAADFVRFSNKYEAQLYFHFLSTPRKLSLERLPRPELKEIYTELSKIDFPLNSDLEKANSKHYHDTLNQINYLANLEEVKVNTLDRFKEELKGYVTLKPHLSEEEKEKEIAVVLGKLEQLESRISNRAMFDKVFAHSLGGKTAFDLLSNSSIDELERLLTETANKDD